MGVADGIGGVKGRRRRGEGADFPPCCRSGRCEASGEGADFPLSSVPLESGGIKAAALRSSERRRRFRKAFALLRLARNRHFCIPMTSRALSWQEIGISVARNPFRTLETLQELGFLAKKRISRRIGATETRCSCHESAILACRIQESQFLARFGLRAPRILAKLASPKSSLGYSVGCASSTMRMRSCWLCTSHLR